MRLGNLCKPKGVAKHCYNEQRLLRNMGAHTVVLDLLQVPYDKVKEGVSPFFIYLFIFLE